MGEIIYETTLATPTLSSSSDESDESQGLEHAPPFWTTPKTKKRLSKQMSISEVPRDMAWEKRRHQERRENDADDLTDEDLNELKGCIELGFGFNEEDGQKLCHTIPALDLYFAVNRKFATSPILSPASSGSASGVSTTSSPSLGGHSSWHGSPRSDVDSTWKICNPGDDPEQVKTKLRHWAQAVACSVMQSS